MEKFFDREEAYQNIEKTIQQIKEGFCTAVWVEGHLGVGKTRFIEYIHECEPELNFFTFSDYDIFYKCEKGAEGSLFECISAIIFELQRTDPRHFELYIQDYFDSLEHISFFDACCLVIPQIKGLKAVSNLIENKYSKIVTMQNKISDRLATYQLVDMFSEMIVYFLQNIYKEKTVVFCIDDAQWLDMASLRVLEALAKKIKYQGAEISISIFLTINDKQELSSDERQNYLNIYRTLTNLFPDMLTIYLENFDLTTTSNVIYSTKRYCLIENIPILYKITAGNPMELEQTLRFSDERVLAILEREQKSKYRLNNNDAFSIEQISDVYYKNIMFSIVLNVLSILHRHISLNLLYQCVSDLYSLVTHGVCLYSDFVDSVNYLEIRDFITKDLGGADISLKHDSISNAILGYLSQNGDYITYGRSIAKTLLQSEHKYFLKAEAHILLAIKLLCEVAPISCFNEVKKIYEKKLDQLEIEFFMVGAKAFLADFSNQRSKTSKFVVNIILPKLVSSANLEIARRVCHVLYHDFTSIFTSTEQISYLMNYTKTQIDLSNLIGNNESAISLFETLYRFVCEDKDTRVQILLLGMSAYEHILCDKRIKELFLESEKIVDSCQQQLKPYTMAIFYRNKGLCLAHSELKYDYLKALAASVCISNISLRHLTFGTIMNNLGLSFFYNGDIKKALKSFLFALKHLERVGYNTARVINNIGTCYYMLHDVKSAYAHFSSAASAQIDGVFMKLCIQTNLALSVYSIGNITESSRILDELITEYESGNMRSRDTLVYCAAMINRGYIAYCENDYFKAAECYQKSLIHTYRYQNNEQLLKRKNMRDLSLNKGMGIKAEINMDIDDSMMDFYKKPYSLIPFAFYVI